MVVRDGNGRMLRWEPLPRGVFWRAKMPVRGLQRLQLLALEAIAAYQLVLLYQYE